MNPSYSILASVVVALVSMMPAVARERAGKMAAPVRSIGLFEAEAKGIIAIKYVPNDARSAQVIVQNKSKNPLTLQLPKAFAGVPVVAQFGGPGMGGPGMGGPGMGGPGMGGMTQSVGGGMGGAGMGRPGMGGPGMGAGGGMFSLPPEATRVLRVATVCLEHGKPEPSPRQPYELIAVENYSENPQLALILEKLGRGDMSQKIAQAAAWHVANGLSWERLAGERIDRAGGYPDERYFTAADLLAARNLVTMTAHEVEERRAGQGSSSPLSQ